MKALNAACKETCHKPAQTTVTARSSPFIMRPLLSEMQDCGHAVDNNRSLLKQYPHALEQMGVTLGGAGYDFSGIQIEHLVGPRQIGSDRKSDKISCQSSSNNPLFMQTKSVISQPEDPLEKEADNVAYQVVEDGARDTMPSIRHINIGSVQRQGLSPPPHDIDKPTQTYLRPPEKEFKYHSKQSQILDLGMFPGLEELVTKYDTPGTRLIINIAGIIVPKALGVDINLDPSKVPGIPLDWLAQQLKGYSIKGVAERTPIGGTRYSVYLTFQWGSIPDEPESPNPMKKGEEESTVQPKAISSDQVPQSPADIQQVLNSPGTPLEPSTREYMETRFGFDFGNVRVHSGAQAAESARAIRAQAYTMGSEIVSPENLSRPGSQANLQLLAHELTHVIQQGQTTARAIGTEVNE